jgi:hypothetical protein
VSKTPVTSAAVAALLISLFAAPAAHAQDSHYWYDQFGNRALLLSGAVVGDAADLSSVYYNPGSLSLVEQTELLLAGLVVTAGRTRIEDAVADGTDLSQRAFDVAPSLIAGEIPFGESKHRFAYSILKRYGSDFRALARVQLTGDEFELPTLALLGNNMRIDARLSEYWVGGTWSYPMKPNLGVGVSTFIAVRSQRRFATNSVQILSTGNRAAIANVSTDYDYSHWRLLWKIGVQGRVADWDLGVTVTTPSVGMFGSGKVGNNLTLVGQRVDQNGNPATEIATDFQTDVSASFKSPLSLALGVARTLGPTTVHGSLEYFAPVGAYSAVDGQPFTGQSSGRAIDTAIIDEVDAVLNAGVGIEREFGPELRGYFGFHTDFNAVSTNPAVNLSHTKWDFYHVSGGATFSAVGHSFALGGELALASDALELDPNDPFRPIGLPPELQSSSYRFTLLLGFSFLER